MKRRCAHEGCITLLARYNKDDRCTVHADRALGAHKVLQSIAMDSRDGRKLCTDCGTWHDGPRQTCDGCSQKQQHYGGTITDPCDRCLAYPVYNKRRRLCRSCYERDWRSERTIVHQRARAAVTT